jgi:hypothetical protein
VIDGGRVEDLPPELVARLWLVDETHLSRRDVLLVTNRELPGAKPLEREP